ncbi:MAG: TIGR02281 family clan AA aspartic protease [Paracoccaceae bacterium]|nr:TIGR02281 family clan AA aspartic protease [Paracoccaceae bacterium]
MDNGELPRLIYLVLLGTAVAGWFIAENRNSLGKTARAALVWGMIFLGFVAGYGLWEDVSRDLVPRQAVLEDQSVIEVPRQGDGHFHLTLRLNGEPIEFLVDTGATDMVLSLADAERAGLDPDNLAFLGSARTANGTVPTAFTRVDEVALGPVVFNNVRAAVNGGEMRGSLLGMSFLSQFERLEIEDNTLRLSY